MSSFDVTKLVLQPQEWHAVFHLVIPNLMQPTLKSLGMGLNTLLGVGVVKWTIIFEDNEIKNLQNLMLISIWNSILLSSLFKTLSCATDLNASKGNKLFKE